MDIGEQGRAFAGRVKWARKSRRMTQQDLADAVGLHRVVLTKIEKGQRQATITDAVALADALRVPVAALMGAEPLHVEETLP